MEKDTILVNMEDYNRLLFENKRLSELVERKDDEAIRKAIKDGLCKVVLTDDESIVGMLGADFSRMNCFVRLDDIHDMARRKAEYDVAHEAKEKQRHCSIDVVFLVLFCLISVVEFVIILMLR